MHFVFKTAAEIFLKNENVFVCCGDLFRKLDVHIENVQNYYLEYVSLYNFAYRSCCKNQELHNDVFLVEILI